ncbi:hypothetical protein Gogos_018438, partial [Gossypium gossypioides]|nr:hypothetical protein [Gossypium gossypioides]
MLPSNQKLIKEKALSKSNQARPVGKKKRHVEASYASEDEDTTFTLEWNDCRRNITDALIYYKNLRKDKGLRDRFSNQHKMSLEQDRCCGLALDGRVANILKRGIDYISSVEGKTLAISIVNSCRCDRGIISKVHCPNLTYTKEGEKRHQMLKGGNLALKNTIHYKKTCEGDAFDKEIESSFSMYKFQLDMLEDQQYDSKWKQK